MRQKIHQSYALTSPVTPPQEPTSMTRSTVVDAAGDSSSSSEDEAGEEEGGVGLEKGVAKLTTGRVLPKTPPMKRK